MVHDDSPYFLMVSRVQHLALCKTFSDLMKRCFPQTFTVMEQIGALTPAGLEPILKRFFVPLLRRKHVLRVSIHFNLLLNICHSPELPHEHLKFYLTHIYYFR